MRVRKVQLRNYRGFADATIEFAPTAGLFAIAGANGAGKSTILDVIADVHRMAHDGVVGTHDVQRPGFDVRDPSSAMHVFVTVSGDGAPDGVLYHLFREADATARSRFEAFAKGHSEFVYYPSNRSLHVPSDSGSWADDDDALSAEAQLGDMSSFFRWFKGEEDLDNEARVRGQQPSQALADVRAAIEVFLADADIRNLRVERRSRQLVVEKSGRTLDVNRLSEGERRMLLFAADLTRRLRRHAAPDVPITRVEACVLIDELELHLHPRWQRSVVHALLRTYPSCQFIVTTHSALVISELSTDHVTLLDNFAVVRPELTTQGRDINTIVEQVLGGSDRPREYKTAIESIESLIDSDDLVRAREQLSILEKKLGEVDAEVVRLQSMIALLDEAPVETH